MDSALYGLCAICGWLVLAYQLWIWRGHRTGIRTMIMAAVIWFDLGVTLSIPEIDRAVDGLLLPNITRLTVHLCVITLATALSMIVLMIVYPEPEARSRSRPRIWLTVASAALFIALYLATLHHQPVRLTVEYARIPEVGAYLVVYLIRAMASLVDLATLCWRCATVTQRPWLHRGLRLIVVSVVFGTLFCINKIGYLIAWWSGYQPPGERYVAAVLVTVTSLGLLGGLTMPACGPALSTALDWMRQQVAHWRLAVLWQDLTSQAPGLVLNRQPYRDRLPFRNAFARHRRVVEICDARLLLAADIPGHVADTARAVGTRAGLHGNELEAFVEATRIAAGLRTLRNGTRPATADPQAPHSPAGGHAGMVTWLTRVAAAYQRTGLIADALRQGGVPDSASALPAISQKG